MECLALIFSSCSVICFIFLLITVCKDIIIDIMAVKRDRAYRALRIQLYKQEYDKVLSEYNELTIQDEEDWAEYEAQRVQEYIGG